MYYNEALQWDLKFEESRHMGQCNAGEHGGMSEECPVPYPGCSWEGGDIPAAHTWTVLSGQCCRLALRSLGRAAWRGQAWDCGQLRVRFGVL